MRLGAGVPVLLDHHDLPFGVRPRDVPLLRRIHQDNRQVPGSAAARACSPKRPGTQKLEEELHERFPSARVLRMDADTMTTRAHTERLLNQFGKGEADILSAPRW